MKFNIREWAASFYPRIYIGIYLHDETCDISVDFEKNAILKKHIRKEFELVDGEFTPEIKEFLNSISDESVFCYTGVLNSAAAQGALPVSTINEALEFEDLSSANLIKREDENWLAYTSNLELMQLQKKLDDIGVDLIISPFFILTNFFSDKVNDKCAMYLLNQGDSLTMGIFEGGSLLYGNHFTFRDNEEEEEVQLGGDDAMLQEEADELDLSMDIDLESLDDEPEEEEIDDDEELEGLDELDDLGELDDLQELDDLDGMDEMEEFSEETASVSSVAAEEENPEAGLEGADVEFKRFELVSKALNTFYHDNRYKSDFIEEIYIADSTPECNDFIHFLEEELFVAVHRRSIDIAEVLTLLSKKEIVDAV